MFRHCNTLALAALLGTPALAQQPAATPVMGTVPTRDALVTGGLQVRGERAELVSNASITAYDRSAAISLARGGDVLVCATSQFHLLHSGPGDSLLFGLDRGAVEIHSPTQPQDVDSHARTSASPCEAPGKYDLRLRVTSNGDTCVDNAGTAAPVLMLSDAFSAASYRLIPGQHVLFEHGSLREVVDNERSPCGCPQPTPPPAQIATAPPGTPITPVQAAAQHPFPAAVSQGLAPTPPPNSPANSPPGEKQTQIATTFSYAEGAPPPPSTQPAPAPATASTPAASGTTGVAAAASSTSAEPPPTPPGAHDLVHAIGRLFHKLFHPKS